MRPNKKLTIMVKIVITDTVASAPCLVIGMMVKPAIKHPIMITKKKIMVLLVIFIHELYKVKDKLASKRHIQGVFL
jgi:hypothetical protein